MKPGCHERIGVGLFQATTVQRGISFVLQPPIEAIEHAGEGEGAVPFRQLDPSVGAVREKILIGVKREVLLIEVRFQVQHVAHADESGIVRPGGERRILYKGTG